MKKLFLLLAAFGLVLGLAACKPVECEDGYVLDEETEECVPEEDPNTKPTISGTTDVDLFVGGTFDPLAGVTANDAEDGALTSSITVSGTVDVTTAGTYTLTYSVTDSKGELTSVTRTVTVSEVAVVYPTGFYNYKFATTDLRHTFMAAAEKYLMNNMAGGVPLFASGSFALYSARLQLPVDSYVAVMGYGTRFATMSADDTTVDMEDGNPGNADEYTYRTHSSTNPVTFNQWIYDTSTDSTFMAEYYGALYDYVFNADKTGYEVIPVMAAAQPAAVSNDVIADNSRTTDTGKFVAYSWDIEVRDGLKWSYFGGTTPSGVTDNDITAQDFVDTYEIALTEEWFRAISGGGDFLTDTQAIAGAQEFVDGTGTWAQVGIKVVGDDNNTIRFTFVNEMSEWNVKYWLSSFVMAPIHTQMYDTLGDTYGTSPSTIAYHGPYVITAYEEDVILRMEKNANYALPALDFFTHKTFKIIEDTEVAFQTFVDGQLESIGLPTAKYEEYKNHPGLKEIPGATTYRIMINGLKTPAGQVAEFPGSTWVPEPLLAYVDFKMAMFFALDRQYLAEDVLKTRTTNMYLFSDAYMVDPEMGVPYRATEQGQTVGVGLSPTTNGYNFDAAQALFAAAIADAIEDGHYTAGTEAAPKYLTVEFNYFSGSDSQVTMYEYIEDAFEAAFVPTAASSWIGIELEGYAKDFPDIYYDYMMIGEFDLSIGGISGSTLDAASFLDTYASDNRSGFTLNWGIDTSVAEIPVQYFDFEGNYHNEMWSFDAIHSALNGRIYLVNGAEAIVPAASDIVKTPNTITFTLDQFTNDDYENIKFSLQMYDLSDGYLDVTNWTMVAPGADADSTKDGHQVVINTDVVPFYYGYDATGSVVYQGDYQIVVYFDYVEDGSSSSTTSPWWEQPTLFESYGGDVVTGAAATLNYSFFTGYDAADVASVTVFEEQLNGFTQLDPTDTHMVELVNTPVVTDKTDDMDTATDTSDDVDYVQIAITGLAYDGWYVIEVEMTDGTILWDYFSTATEVELEVYSYVDNNGTATDTTDDKTVTMLSDTGLDLLVSLDVDSDITAVTSIVAHYQDALGAWKTHAITAAKNTTVTLTDTNDLVWTVSGLMAETDYVLEVTLSDTTVLYFDVATLAVPITLTTVDDKGNTDDTDDVDTVTDNGFTLFVTIDDDSDAAIDQVDLWYDDEVVKADLNGAAGVYVVTGLMQDADYTVSVTTDNGGFYTLDVTTEPTLAELAVVVNDNETTTGDDAADDDYEEIFDTGFNFEVIFELDDSDAVISNGTVATIDLYEVNYGMFANADIWVDDLATGNNVEADALTANVYNVTGLDAWTDYYVVVVFDTGLELVLEVTTAFDTVEVALELDSSDEAILTHNAFSFTVDEGMNTQSFTVKVFEDKADASDTEVATVTDNGDGTYDVASLSAETDYYVLVTFADGTFFFLEVTTEAAPS